MALGEHGEVAMSGDEPAAEPFASVTRGSAARFMAEGLTALLALVTGALVARQLGAVGKGRVSTLAYLIALFGPACAFGLGEAGVTLVGRRRATLQEALSSTLALLLPIGVLGMAAVLGLGATQLGLRWRAVSTAVLVACVAVPFTTLVNVAGLLVESQQWLLYTSAVRAAMAVVTLIATWLLVVVAHKAVTGALAGLLAGAIAASLLLLVALARMGAPPRVRWSSGYARRALRLGFPVQVSYVIVILSSRLDLLLVNAIRGSRSAGFYSVALTLGQLVAYAPIAVSIASYPRVSRLPESEVPAFVARVSRIAIAAAIASAAALALVLPVLTPLAFGRQFRAAVLPALVLLLGGLLYSEQWVLCRAWAARGRTWLLVVSYSVSVVVMVVLDLILVPTFGLSGAATASVLSSAAGVVAAGVAYRRDGGPGFRLRQLLPGTADFMAVLRLPKDLILGQLGAGGSGR
ncbi:MAG: lipopolysaccharide biosynthesis protein [Acidimicrobiales bacterium]